MFKGSTSPGEAAFGASSTPFLSVFYARARAHPERVFLRQPLGGGLREIRWGEAYDEARRMAAALCALGVGPGERVGIYSKNCAHWVLADLAILMCGAVSVPFYPTVGAGELAELLRLSDLRAMFVGKVDAWDDRLHVLPAELVTIAFPHHPGNARVSAHEDWDALVARHPPTAAPHEPALSDPFTIIFTSGTTGAPKGAVLTYEGPRALAQHELASPSYHVFHGAAERLFSYLPLNHVAERMATEVSGIFAGATISFAESISTFARDLRRVQPSFFFAVPRIWTMIREKLEGALGAERLALVLRTPVLGALVARALRYAVGLGRAQVVLSGAAPLPAATLAFFRRLGIVIQEVYGMTEAGGGVTVNPRSDVRPGTVGRAMAGAEVRVDAESGEVLVRTPWMMREYFRAPERTAELLRGGFLHTGDRGTLDAQGRLSITGRVSEAFKTASGKFVVPSRAEGLIMASSWVEQVMVTGRGLTHPIALVCLAEAAKAEAPARLAHELGRVLDQVCAALEPHERVRKAVVLRRPFAVEDGTLTPTLKLRRHVIDARYTGAYETWLARAETVVFED
jgi:long-chain acyl-CoA synthetase